MELRSGRVEDFGDSLDDLCLTGLEDLCRDLSFDLTSGSRSRSLSRTLAGIVVTERSKTTELDLALTNRSRSRNLCTYGIM